MNAGRLPVFTLVALVVAAALGVYTLLNAPADDAGPGRIDGAGAAVDRESDRDDAVNADDLDLARAPVVEPIPEEDDATEPRTEPPVTDPQRDPWTGRLIGEADIEALRRSPVHGENAGDLVDALDLPDVYEDALADLIEDWTTAHATAAFEDATAEADQRARADRMRRESLETIFEDDPALVARVLEWIDGNVRVPHRDR